MKSLRKVALLSGVFLLSLTACDLHKKCYCLESSNDDKYHAGMCLQVTRSEIVETIYLVNPPLNPEASPEKYTYDISWVDMVKNTSITMTGGLKGKRISRVFRISDHAVLVEVFGKTEDQEATFGYIKVSSSAFTAQSQRAKDAFLYAYVSIGDTGGLVNKPSDAK